ncbi:lectin-like protein LEC [Ricinus communis]|uniref:lectin-like protein LEC n=1 Tax=Ricinus communis TaxID=3988 RepID=UPI00201A9652|nr:lectin-like protein LEC [Ricinus communis]
MATFPIAKSALPFHLLIFHLLTLYPIYTLSLETLITSNRNFDPQTVLLGNATISGNGSSVQLTTPNASSSGLLLYKNPFRLHSSTPSKPMSFSTEFEFSFTGNLIGLSLVMGPFNFVSNFMGQGAVDSVNKKGYLGIEFGYSRDGNDGNSTKILVLIRVNNEPLGHVWTERGQRMKAWIDYDASSKRIEIRINELNGKRPYDPFAAYALDLSKMWSDNEAFVVLGSNNGGNPSGTCNVYSWRFRLRKVPNWMHSLPVNPHGSMHNDNSDNERLRVHKRKFCPLTILAGLIFASGCVALLAFVGLYMWPIFVNRRSAFPLEGKMQRMDFRYEKISVVVEKDGNVVKN